MMDIQEQLKILQSSMEMIDSLDREDKSGFDALVYQVVKLKDIKVKMYQESGHSMPHIHIDYGHQNHIASYSIDKAERIAGTLSSKYDTVVKRWINNNREELMEVWDSLQTGKESPVIIGELKGNA